MSRRPLFRSLLLAVLACTAVARPASAAADVTVVFAAGAPGPVTHGTTKPPAACPVTVAENSDGTDVLAGARAAGCIASYSTVTFAGFGTFVSCIDGVCGGADPRGAGCWYWAMRENGIATDYGVDGFRAANGDVLTFHLEPYGA